MSHSSSPGNIRSSRDRDSWARMQSGPVTGSPSMCGFGCGVLAPLFMHGKKWRWCTHVKGHQRRGSTMGQAAREAARVRMTVSNPMKRPEVAAKVSASWEGREFYRSPEGAKRVSDAARKRMLGPGNPMKDPAIARKVAESALSRTEKTKTEEWFHEVWPAAEFKGHGTMWIGRRNPDFRLGKRQCAEVTQHGVFNSAEPIPRTVEGYAMPTIRHYESKGWTCLVVFLQSHRRKKLTTGLRTAIASFIAGDRSAIFDLGRFWFVDPLPADSGSTTSPSPEQRPTSPTES